MFKMMEKCRKHKKHKMVLHALGIVALLLLLCHHVMGLVHMLRRKKHNNMQDKIEHFQHCFERLLDR